MIGLDSDCETKIHCELKLDEVIKTIPTDEFNVMSADRGVHPSQTVDWCRVVTHKNKYRGSVAEQEECHAHRGQRQSQETNSMNVTLTLVCVTGFNGLNVQTASSFQWRNRPGDYSNRDRSEQRNVPVAFVMSALKNCVPSFESTTGMARRNTNRGEQQWLQLKSTGAEVPR